MSVQFVLGRAGSGKTTHLLNEITKLVKADPMGPPIYWLLPRQATFQAQRLLTTLLGGFSRVHVVSFDDLGKEILTHCGDIDIPEVTALGRRMVIGHLLRRHRDELKFYASSAHRPGLATELDATFGEFDRAGLDETALQQLRVEMEADPRSGQSLTDKLADLNLLLTRYNAFIGQDKLDPQRRMSLILNRVSGCSMFKEAHLFVDDFFDFSAHEKKLLTAVAGLVPHAMISLLIDPESNAVTDPTSPLNDLSVFHRTERTYRSLLHAFKESAIPVLPAIPCKHVHRFESADLVDIERQLFTNAVTPRVATALEFLDAPDTRSEVDAIARQIRAAISTGVRYREIGLLVRNLADYQEIIDASFAEHQLPYFADHRRTSSHHPLLQLVRSALQVARHNWSNEAVQSLLKSGLSGLSDDDADALENYVLKHRIRGRRWETAEPWVFKRELLITEDVPEDESAVTPATLTEADPIDQHRRGLHEKLSPILELARSKKPWPIREIATRIVAMLDAFNVPAQLVGWMDQAKASGDLERSAEHEQVWTEFTELLDHLVELLGDELIAFDDFLAVLDSGLESFDLALAPPKVDQILVGQIDRTRPPELKLVFVLGLNEGTFPRVANERCVISDRERRTLRARNIDLDQDADRQLLDERFLAYLAFTRASQNLIVSRNTADASARPTNPSAFWLELLRLFPQASIEHVERSNSNNPDQIGTPRQLVTSLLRWVQTDPKLASTGPEATPWSMLYQWLATETHPSHLGHMLEQAWPALRYDNTAALNPELAKILFAEPLRARVTQLESMAACPFQHFSKYGLQLRSREKTEVTAIDLSNSYHDILEQLMQDVLQSRQDWCELPPAELKQMIRIHAAEIGRRLRGELMLSTSRNRYLLDRIERTLQQSLATMIEMNRRGKYRPAFAGITFGEDQTLPAYQVTTPAGHQVQLHGKIDRVDLNDKRAGFVVMDYKMSASALALDRVYHGLSLQLLTYLLVIQSNGPQLVKGKLTPAAAFLLQLLRSPQAVDHPSEAIGPDDPKYNLQVKPRGIIDSRALLSLDQQFDAGFSEVVSAFISKDGKLGHINRTDVAEKADFEALLSVVHTRIGELADEVISGNISVAPYMIGRQTPCPHCEYRSVCRFEPGTNAYRMLPSMKREDVLKVVTGTAID